MENKRYGGIAETREEALYGALKEFEKDILNQKESCNRAFRIQENKYEIKDFKQYMTYCDGIEYTFKINEIKVNETQFVCHADKVEFNPIRKYNLKERIKILFKGGLK